MKKLELTNRYYLWNNKIVFLYGNQLHLWNGGNCKTIVCKKNEHQKLLIDGPFQTTEETIPCTDKVLSELRLIPTKCLSCVYCENIKLPVGQFGINGWKVSKQCELKVALNEGRMCLPDATALMPECSCFTKYPLVKMKEGVNDSLKKLSDLAFHEYNAWFMASDRGFPDENVFYSLFDRTDSLFVIDFNEIGDTDFDRNRSINWSIRAWCEIPMIRHMPNVIRYIWDAVYFRSEGTAAVCSLDMGKMMFLPFGIPKGYYVFTESLNDDYLDTYGVKISWKME